MLESIIAGLNYGLLAAAVVFAFLIAVLVMTPLVLLVMSVITKIVGGSK